MTDELDLFTSHPVRAALLGLLRKRGTVTSTEAARALGGASGLYSFHLRQLARYGLVEEAAAPDNRARPWRLAAEEPAASDPEDLADLGELGRGLEDESYRRWLAARPDAPVGWQVDEAFSEVLHLTPAELTALARSIRGLLRRYRPREHRPDTRPAGAAPVAVVTRLFPLVDP